MEHRFVWYDVFTDRPFAGNPLAVFPDASGLGDAEMARIARELNLSETTFVLPAEDPSTTHRVRIFTPSRELAFAGHPTVGTAVALAELAGGGDADHVLGLGAGPTPVAVRRRPDGVMTAAFRAPQLPRLSDSPVDVAGLAALVGLDEDDFDPTCPVHVADAGGTAFVVGVVRHLGALARSRAAGSAPGVVGVYLAAHEGGVWRTRMFAPAVGVPEDPATGSAACAFAGTLHGVLGHRTDGRHDVTIHQGVEMGRPSELHLSYDVAGGQVSEVRLTGAAARVLDGTVTLA